MSELVSIIKFSNKLKTARLQYNVRMGQHFCNLYIKHPWPELFYANDEDALVMIREWLTAHQYTEDLPLPQGLRNPS